MNRREMIAWGLAACLLVASAFSFATRLPGARPPVGGEESVLEEENQKLRAASARLRNEALALRAELDRLLERVRRSGGGGAGGAASPAAAIAAPGMEVEDPQAVARRVDAISLDIARLSRDVIGNPENFKALFGRIAQLQAMGPEALPAIREAFHSSNDPSVRRTLGSLLAMRGGPDEERFLLEEAEREADPETKQILLGSIDAMGGARSSAAQAELRSMLAAPEPSTRAGAISNLTNLADSGTLAAVQAALDTDASEAVRFAALDVLMRAPERREAALATAARDPSARLRGIAECRSRLTNLEAEARAGGS